MKIFSGYLEDQKCDEAAKTFLETSPHLEECRMVLARGKRFTRTVSDMTLTDILDKYSSIHALGEHFCCNVLHVDLKIVGSVTLEIFSSVMVSSYPGNPGIFHTLKNAGNSSAYSGNLWW